MNGQGTTSSGCPGKSGLRGQPWPVWEEVRRLLRELDIAREERDILKKVVAIFSKTPKADSWDHRKEFSVERMAKVLDVSTSGYYGWFSRPESGREQERLLLDVLVKAAYEASRCRYGSLKISRALAEQGKQYRRNRVADSMRRQGLRSKVRRKFVVTTDTKHDLKASRTC